jgi:nucleoid-associated protein YgaU
LSSDSLWVEVIVKEEDIYQLALQYYGDRDEYIQIYNANSDIIGEDFQLYKGMSLKIPMTKQFEEQPIFLNLD